MGADINEIMDDYAKTYTNYYDVQDGKHMEIAPATLDTIREIIVRNMTASFESEDITAPTLAEAAEKYLLAIGLSADEVTALKGKLAAE